jgi:hypothetical protein
VPCSASFRKVAILSSIVAWASSVKPSNFLIRISVVTISLARSFVFWSASLFCSAKSCLSFSICSFAFIFPVGKDQTQKRTRYAYQLNDGVPLRLKPRRSIHNRQLYHCWPCLPMKARLQVMMRRCRGMGGRGRKLVDSSALILQKSLPILALSTRSSLASPSRTWMISAVLQMFELLK